MIGGKIEKIAEQSEREHEYSPNLSLVRLYIRCWRGSPLEFNPDLNRKSSSFRWDSGRIHAQASILFLITPLST